MNIEAFIFITVFIFCICLCAVVQHIHSRINKLQNTVKLQGKMICTLRYLSMSGQFSEESLKKDWDNAEEDEAWRNL